VAAAAEDACNGMDNKTKSPKKNIFFSIKRVLVFVAVFQIKPTYHQKRVEIIFNSIHPSLSKT
jgi:hypothetical protein